MQYYTAFNCPDCSEHTFEIETELGSEYDLADSNCTNCGHVLTQEEITSQAKTLPAAAIQKLLFDAAELRKYAGH